MSKLSTRLDRFVSTRNTEVDGEGKTENADRRRKRDRDFAAVGRRQIRQCQRRDEAPVLNRGDQDGNRADEYEQHAEQRRETRLCLAGRRRLQGQQPHEQAEAGDDDP